MWNGVVNKEDDQELSARAVLMGAVHTTAFYVAHTQIPESQWEGRCSA